MCFKYVCAFEKANIWLTCDYRYIKTKNPAVIAPFLPLSFIVGYQADYAYGNKIDRIRGALYYNYLL